MTDNKNKEMDGAEYGVDSRYKSAKEKDADGKALMEARLIRMKNISEDQVLEARLLQLKLKMEEYLKKPVYQKQNFFTEFLTSYVDTIYSRRNNFAKDIDISPIQLSQVLNNHREPREGFMLRLMIHSEKAYKNIGGFKKEMWYQIYFHQQICEIMSDQDKWRAEVEKHVRISKSVKVSV